MKYNTAAKKRLYSAFLRCQYRYVYHDDTPPYAVASPPLPLRWTAQRQRRAPRRFIGAPPVTPSFASRRVPSTPLFFPSRPQLRFAGCILHTRYHTDTSFER